MARVLLIVDIQNDYFPGGNMELVGAEAAALQAQKLLAHFRHTGEKVVHVQHVATRPDATFFLPGTKGANIHPLVQPLPTETVIVKHAPNAFYKTELAQVLASCQATDLVVCGMMTHMCIDTTVRAAKDAGFACTVAQDACATKALTFAGKTVPAAQVQAAFMAALGYYFAEVVTTDDVIVKSD